MSEIKELRVSLLDLLHSPIGWFQAVAENRMRDSKWWEFFEDNNGDKVLRYILK